MKNALISIFGLVVFVGGYACHSFALAFCGFSCFAMYAVKIVNQYNREEKASNEYTNSAREHLRQEFLQAQQLAFANLYDADDRTRSKVSQLLIEAGNHLSCPSAAGIFFRPDVAQWHRDGLPFITQVRQLIDQHLRDRVRIVG